MVQKLMESLKKLARIYQMFNFKLCETMGGNGT